MEMDGYQTSHLPPNFFCYLFLFCLTGVEGEISIKYLFIIIIINNNIIIAIKFFFFF